MLSETKSRLSARLVSEESEREVKIGFTGKTIVTFLGFIILLTTAQFPIACRFTTAYLPFYFKAVVINLCCRYPFKHNFIFSYISRE